MELALSAEERREEIIADLSNNRLSAATQAAIMHELSHKASGFRASDLIAIADAVTGERCKSSKAAIAAIERFSQRKTA